MVDLSTPVKALILKAGNEVAEQGVSKAKKNAPVDTGQMAGSIHWLKTGLFRWTVRTVAYGWNGFAYPARIEAGERVMPTQGNAVFFHGQWHLFADASKKSHFMEKTMSEIHI